MTEAKSRRKSTFFTYLLIAIAGLGMVFIGVPVLNRQGGNRNIATVNGKDIPIARFRRLFSEQEQQFHNTLPRKQIQQLALRRLIDETLLQQHALSSGYQLSDQTLYQEVKARFGDNKTYENWLRQNRISARNYEANLRDTLAVQNYYQLLERTTIANQAEIKILLSLLAEKRDITVITLPLAKKAQNLDVRQDDLDAFYRAHKSDYLSPEKVSLRYVMLDADALVSAQSVTDAEIEAEKSKRAALEQRSGRYVIFATDADASTVEQAIARKQKTFDAIYQAIEKDKTAGEAGTIDLHQKGQGPSQQVDEQLFSLDKTGEVSALFTTDYGPMLVSLTAIEKDKIPDDSALRKQIAARKSQDAYQKIANQAFDKAQGNGTLEEIASLAHSRIFKLSEITAKANEPDWLNQEKIRNVLFGEGAARENTIAEPIELDSKHSLFYQVDQRIAPQQLDYPSVAKQVEQDYRTATARAELKKTAAQIIAALPDWNAVKTLVSANDGKIKEYPSLGRFDPVSGLSAATTATLFAQTQQVAQSEDADGNILVSEIKHIVPGTTESMPKQLQKNLTEQLSIRRTVDVAQGFAKWLRARAKVSVAQALLDEKPES